MRKVYVLYNTDTTSEVKRRRFLQHPDDPVATSKPWVWLELVTVRPLFNEALETQTGPVPTVDLGGRTYTETWTNAALTQPEIDAIRDAKAAEAMDDKYQRAIKALGLVIADNTPLTPQDVRSQFIAHYKTLLANEGE